MYIFADIKNIELMKKIFIIPIAILLASCDYSKDASVVRDFMGEQSYYMVRVWPPQGFTNSGALIIYKIPMEGINDKKVDSINTVADKYIEDCKKYAK